MSHPEHHSAYVAACQHLAAGRSREALTALLRIPAPASEQPEVQLALARSYLALERRKAAFRIVSRLQAAHGAGPWSDLMQELFDQPTPAPVVVEEAPVAAASTGRFRWSTALVALAVICAAGVAAYLAFHAAGTVLEAETQDDSPMVVPRPLDARDLLKRMGDPKRAEAVYFALLPGASTEDLPAIIPVLTDCVEPKGRLCAARLLGAIGSEESVEALLKAAGTDPDERVRCAAAIALRGISGEAAWLGLAGLLQGDASACVRLLAAAGLEKLRGRSAHPHIEAALSREGDAYARKVLASMLSPESWGTRPALVHPGAVTPGAYLDMPYLLYTPSGYREGSHSGVLLALHGEDGDAEGLIAACRDEAEARGYAVIAPFFDYGKYPEYRYLNIVPRLTPVDVRLLDIVHALGERMSIDTTRLHLYGHGFGAEAAASFALAHPERVARAGGYGGEEYVLPGRSRVFPHGTRAHPLRSDLAPLDYGELAKLPFLLVSGAGDAPGLQAAAQGFVHAAESATPAGEACGVELIMLDGGAPSVAQAFAVVATRLLEAP